MAYTAPYTWDLPAPASASVDVLRRGVMGKASEGVVLRRQTLSSESAQGIAAVRTFSLVYRLATRSTYEKVMLLWERTKGGAQGISYTNNDLAYGSSETLIVRMTAAPTFNVVTTNDVFFTFTVDLEEMLHSPGT